MTTRRLGFILLLCSVLASQAGVTVQEQLETTAEDQNLAFILVMQPGVGAQVLAIVLVFYLFADGITSLIFAVRMPPAAGGAWMMLGAIASLVIGVLMWMQWPAAGELAVGILIGIKLILDGITLIGVGSIAKAAAD